MESAAPRSRPEPSRALGSALVHLVLVAGGLVVIFPFFWMVSTSLKSLQEALASPPLLLPSAPAWTNYLDAWRAAPFARYFGNTIFIATASTAATLVTGACAAYAFARLEFPGRDVCFILFLATLMVPGEVTLIPNFLILRTLGWLDTYYALIVPFSANVLAIFLLRQFFLTIPRDLWEASQLDGASHPTFLVQVVVPISAPALLTAGLYNFLASWNSFFWPLIMTSRPDVRPIQVALRVFQQEHGTEYHLLMAASTLAIIPIIVLFLFVQRQFIEGIARSGIRG